MQNTVKTTSQKIQLEESKSDSFQDFQQFSLLSEVFEEFIDGILILTEQGSWVQANACARQIFNQLLPDLSPSNLVPEEIFRVCQVLTDSCASTSQAQMVIESEICTERPAGFRVRVQWLRLEEAQRRFLVVIIEDRYRSLQHLVDSEAQKYNLTPGEKKVWLLRRANYTYNKIANTLKITLNTVKKHLKNIHAKQKDLLNIEEWY